MLIPGGNVRIGIIGTGAVGGYYGALLVKNGLDIHFLLNSDFEHVRDNGLLIESKDGDFVLEKVNAYSCSCDMPKCDVIIVALKTTHNDLLKSILPDVIKKNGIIVMLQNGLNIEKDISEIIPSAPIIGGLCFLCSNKVGPGHIRHLDYGSIRLGEYKKNVSETGVSNELQLIADTFSNAGIPIHLAENLEKARWEKLVWNMGFNGPTVILNATTDLIMKNESSCAMVKEIMLEVIQGARVCGYDITDDFSEIMLNATKQMIDYSPSMKLDYNAGRPLEIENIYWRPIREAEIQGYNMKKSTIIAYQLDFMDRVNRKNI
jgi:2-dehydropantoate 2-reductase